MHQERARYENSPISSYPAYEYKYSPPQPQAMFIAPPGVSSQAMQQLPTPPYELVYGQPTPAGLLPNGYPASCSGALPGPAGHLDLGQPPHQAVAAAPMTPLSYVNAQPPHGLTPASAAHPYHQQHPRYAGTHVPDYVLPQMGQLPPASSAAYPPEFELAPPQHAEEVSTTFDEGLVASVENGYRLVLNAHKAEEKLNTHLTLVERQQNLLSLVSSSSRP